MSTDDQTRSARLHGEALLAAQEPLFQSVIERLTESAEGRDDLRVECAGLLAGWWFASPRPSTGTSSSRSGCCCSPARSTATCWCTGSGRRRAPDRRDHLVRPQPLRHVSTHRAGSSGRAGEHWTRRARGDQQRSATPREYGRRGPAAPATAPGGLGCLNGCTREHQDARPLTSYPLDTFWSLIEGVGLRPLDIFR